MAIFSLAAASWKVSATRQRLEKVLSGPELLRAMFDGGYFPPNTPPDNMGRTKTVESQCFYLTTVFPQLDSIIICGVDALGAWHHCHDHSHNAASIPLDLDNTAIFHRVSECLSEKFI